MAIAPGDNLVARDALDEVAACRGSAGPRDARRSRRLGEIEDQIVGRVIGGGDLLQDDIALALELVGIENGLGQDIGQDIKRQCGQSFLRTRA